MSQSSVTPTQTLQSQIDVSVSTDASATETEQTVANVIAQNLQAAQDDVEAKQEETGEYGSENTIIAYMGFVPNFNNYRLVHCPTKKHGTSLQISMPTICCQITSKAFIKWQVRV